MRVLYTNKKVGMQNASPGNSTRIHCLEGNDADHYTSDAYMRAATVFRVIKKVKQHARNTRKAPKQWWELAPLVLIACANAMLGTRRFDFVVGAVGISGLSATSGR